MHYMCIAHFAIHTLMNIRRLTSYPYIERDPMTPSHFQEPRLQPHICANITLQSLICSQARVLSLGSRGSHYVSSSNRPINASGLSGRQKQFFGSTQPISPGAKGHYLRAETLVPSLCVVSVLFVMCLRQRRMISPLTFTLI